MNTFHLRPATPGHDFTRIVELSTLAYGEFTTESDLQHAHDHASYPRRLTVALDDEEQFAGYCEAAQYPGADPGEFNLQLAVVPPQRGRGAGSQLYEGALADCVAQGAVLLRASVREDCPDGLRFAERRGFAVKGKAFESVLDLAGFDESPFTGAIARLQAHGFRITNMAELGNTEEARRHLFALNNATGADVPGSTGTPWHNFEEFDASVCSKPWYRPEGQFVAIDEATGEWAGMRAMEKEASNASAYNLHTGVDRRYRQRGVATALKLIGIRYARERGARRVR